MFVHRIPNRNSSPTYLLRETFRRDGKVKTRTLANITHLGETECERIKAVLSKRKSNDNDNDNDNEAQDGKLSIDPASDLTVERALPFGHWAAVVAMIRKIGLDKAIGHPSDRNHRICLALIASRVVDPQSKLATSKAWREEANGLLILLNLQDVTTDEIYAAMDWLVERQPKIEKKLAKQRLDSGDIALYDVSSTYFEGSACPLATHGYSRDHRDDRPQLVFGLLMNAKGQPVSITPFEGNMSDPGALTHTLAKTRDAFGLKNLTVVGDRGMVTRKRIEEDVTPHGFDYVSALRSDEVRILIDNNCIQMSLFDEQNLCEIEHPNRDERLVVCRNPMLAESRGQKREALLQSTEKELEKIKQAVDREKNPLRGEAKIGLRVGNVINKKKVSKHFSFTITDSSFDYSRDEASISRESRLDGLYVIRSSLADKTAFPPQRLVDFYKQLKWVERAFRTMKGPDIEVRPIYHYNENRVRSHLLICMLAYDVVWHINQAWRPVTYHNEADPEPPTAGRADPVSPAKPNEPARQKAATHETASGHPVRGVREHLASLATITFSEICVAGHRCPKLNEPTDAQKELLALLGVRLAPPHPTKAR